jgi:site-specific recombinase XerD
LDKIQTGPVSIDEIARCGRRWAQQQHKQGRAQSLKWSAERFIQVACAWCRFMGQLKEDLPPKPAYAAKIDAWALFLRAEENVAESTIFNYSWWARCFLHWLKEQGLPLRQVTLTQVDRFMKHLSLRGLNRVSLATAVKALRRFSRYAYQQGWCHQAWASAIVSPRLFRQESLPAGPAWPDVQRLITATEGSTCRHLRNRAILLLLAVYGLRRGEVRALRLEDVDWTRRILRVRRSKTARVQEFPLTQAMGQAFRRYLKTARPQGYGCELFLTLRAPFRPLSEGGIYDLTRSLLDRLDIASSKRGPHALRHSCASFLLNSGLPLKQVGDHLGHRSPSATQIYAKVDLTGLRAVAAFDLGGLL